MENFKRFSDCHTPYCLVSHTLNVELSLSSMAIFLQGDNLSLSITISYQYVLLEEDTNISCQSPEKINPSHQ
jgi:hypothetical protein